MQTTEIQNPPPDMPVDWAVYIQTKLKQIYNDLHQLGIGIFVDINGNVALTGPVHIGVDNGLDYLSISPYTTDNIAYLSARESALSGGTTKLALQVFNGGVYNNAMLIDNLGNISFGTTSPTADAKLDVVSTTAAFMPPRMTTVQRDALTASDGMMVYNTTTKRFEGRENGAWVDL